MHLLDVNIVLAAQRREHAHHDRTAPWLLDLVNGDAAFGVPRPVFSGFLRIATNSRSFAVPTTVADALAFVRSVRSSPAFAEVRPSAGHFDRFLGLVEEHALRGNDVPDAYLAALAIETRSDWVSYDRGFDRFRGLRRIEP